MCKSSIEINASLGEEQKMELRREHRRKRVWEREVERKKEREKLSEGEECYTSVVLVQADFVDETIRKDFNIPFSFIKLISLMSSMLAIHNFVIYQDSSGRG